MPWLELKIATTREQAPRFERALERAGALSVTLQDRADEPIFEPALGETPLWTQTEVTGLFEADVATQAIERKLGLGTKQPAAAEFRWQTVADKDWEREWITHYQPIRCHHNLWICPSWCAPPDPNAVNLLLDPGLAFGTGTHPTTFLCLQWLAQQPLQGCKVVDYGCGSGILGIAALLLGADSALGIDIDPQALLASRANTERNGLDPARFPVYLPGDAPQLAADLVVANILAGPLVELAGLIKPLLRPGARLCLSGVLASQADTVIAAYCDVVQFAPVETREEWAMLHGELLANAG